MKHYYDEASNTTGFHKYIGTAAEVFTYGEVLKLAAGQLTKADVDSTGEQRFFCECSETGDGISENITVSELKKTRKFQVKAAGAITAPGDVYTLDTACTGITTTKVNGVFQVDETDGATPSTVIGHFIGDAVL